ncbi:MAG: hypothetical protein NUV65_06780 [Candidatus Roizmanbacteria bacterium]|nr:hypothetical protein [Candidatus Roizmanbacteria bacterium]
MKTKVTLPVEQNQTPLTNKRVLPADELKKFTDFFSILIEIDQRKKRNKSYERQNN